MYSLVHSYASHVTTGQLLSARRPVAACIDSRSMYRSGFRSPPLTTCYLRTRRRNTVGIVSALHHEAIISTSVSSKNFTVFLARTSALIVVVINVAVACQMCYAYMSARGSEPDRHGLGSCMVTGQLASHARDGPDGMISTTRSTRALSSMLT
jgi:hypothetical protein